MTDAAITKGEREDLQRLIRQREKVLKSAAKQRSASQSSRQTETFFCSVEEVHVASSRPRRLGLATDR
jgi:hypothetical protein